MSTSLNPNSEREQRLDEIAAAYFKAVEAGERPEPEQWIHRHPDLADDLKAFFSAQNQVAAFGKRRDEPPGETTVGLDGPNDGTALGTVRYFGDYELLSEIARGGMGIVFKARQVSLNRVVALKMILAGQLASENDVLRFRAEAEAVGNLDHPHIVPIYEIGAFEGQQYFSMKLMEGGSLSASVGGGQWTVGRKEGQMAAARLMATVARAIQHAHQRGILHRDLKPANILLDKQGQPQVTDFGLAKRVQSDQSLSQSGAIVGTPLYMSPEQASGRKGLTTAADIYSLGAILYQLIAGRPPFMADTPLDVLMQVVEKDPPSPRSFNPNVDVDLETICMKCLRKEPSRRYASAEALADDLDRWLKGEPIEARPVGSRERIVKWAKRKPAAAALVAVSILGVLALSVIVAWFLNVLYDRNQALQVASGDLKTERDKAIEEQGKARVAEKLAKDKGDEATHLLDRTKRILMTTQLLNVGSIYRQNPIQALAMLEDPNVCPPDMRDDFAWRFYKAQCQRWRLKWEWPKGDIDALAVSPDGKLLATSKHKVITLWELNTGKRVKSLEGHKLTVTRLLFSPDSRMLASGAQHPGPLPGEPVMSFEKKAGTPPTKMESPSEIKCWDVAKGEMLFNHLGIETDIATFAFSRDGQTLAAGYHPQAARVWQIESGKELAHLPECGGFVNLSPDGKLLLAAKPHDGMKLAVGAPQGFLQIWDVRTKERAQEIPMKNAPEQSGVNAAFAMDGKEIACNVQALSLCGLDGKNQQVLLSRVPLAGMAGRSYSNSVDRFERRHIAVSPDGKLVASLVVQSNVAVWDAEGRQELVAIQGSPGYVEDIAFTSNGKELAIVERAKDHLTTLRVWSLAPRAEDYSYPNAASAAFLPGSRGFVTAMDNKLKRIDLDSGAEETIADLPDRSFVFDSTKNGSIVGVSGLSGRDVSVWDVEKRSKIISLKGVFLGLRFSADGSRFLFCEQDGIRIFNLETGVQTSKIALESGQFALGAFAPDGRTVAYGNNQVKLTLWDLATDKPIRTLSKPLFPVRYLPNGRMLVIDSIDEKTGIIKLKIWDVDKDEEVAFLGKQMIQTLPEVSADGRTLARLEGADIEVTDLDSLQTRLKLPISQMGLLAFSADGRFLAFGGFANKPGEGRLAIWDTRPIQETTVRPKP